MQVLDVPRDEAEYILHEMRSEFEPDIIIVPDQCVKDAARALMPSPDHQTYQRFEQILMSLMVNLPSERWPELVPWLLTNSRPKAYKALRHCRRTGKFPQA